MHYIYKITNLVNIKDKISAANKGKTTSSKHMRFIILPDDIVEAIQSETISKRKICIKYGYSKRVINRILSIRRT